MLAWLQILARKRSTIVDLIKAHWRTFGRNVFTRYDYEDVDASGANLMMTYLEVRRVADRHQKAPSLSAAASWLRRARAARQRSAFSGHTRRQLRVQSRRAKIWVAGEIRWT